MRFPLVGSYLWSIGEPSFVDAACCFVETLFSHFIDELPAGGIPTENSEALQRCPHVLAALAVGEGCLVHGVDAALWSPAVIAFGLAPHAWPWPSQQL